MAVIASGSRISASRWVFLRPDGMSEDQLNRQPGRPPAVAVTYGDLDGHDVGRPPADWFVDWGARGIRWDKCPE